MEKRIIVVHPFGDLNATIALCGEQPGINEVRHNPPRPFVGPAGQLLDECLTLAKIQRSKLYLTNVIKDLDKPLAYYISLKNRTPSLSADGSEYIKMLGEELSRLPNLNVVVALGNVPLLALCGRTGITKWRGSVLESSLIPGLKVVPTFHPATVIPPKCQYLNKPLIVEDLLLAVRESAFKEIRRTQRNLLTSPTFDFACEFLRKTKEKGLSGAFVSFDIEVINEELDCISFSTSPTESLCVPFKNHEGDYFTPQQEYTIMSLIASILSDSRIAKLGANIIFDTQFMLHKYGIIPRGPLHCTQIAQKILYPDLKVGLDNVCQMYTDIPYYKQDGKKWIKMQGGTEDRWWTYNALDSVVPSEAFPKQLESLRKQDNIATYERQRKLLPPLLYMSERGIKVNLDGLRTEKEAEENEVSTLAESLFRIVGREINYNSPKQMKEYFYREKGLKPYKKRSAKGGYSESVDVNALKRLARRGIEEAKILLKIRHLEKRISTYLDESKIDSDGRIHTSYKPVGTTTGRISSGETIFGKGGNLQNWPHDLLRYLVFDDGYLGYSFDLSQIENRIVAYVGGVITQIEAFESGIDLHTLSASLLLDKPYEEISREEGSSPIGDGTHSERYWGKKCNHATNYNVGYRTFALVNEIDEGTAKYILAKIHRAYPQIESGYHQLVRNMLFKDRTVTNLFGRKRLFLGPIVPSRFTPKSACEDTYRKAYSHFAQSSCADKVAEQGLEYIYYNQDLFHSVELLSQVHDSVVFQIPLSIGWKRHAEILMKIKTSLETPLKWHDREFATPCDLAIGKNMYKDDMIEIKSKNFPDSINDLAHLLESTSQKLSV